MAGGIRAPLYVHKGEYDSGDFRSALSDVRGFNVGVIPGTNSDSFKVTAVSGSSARVAVAGGRAWIPLTKAGVRDTRQSHYVDLPAPGVAFNLTTASSTADRYDLIIARVTDDNDVTPYAEVPLGTFAAGLMSAGWTIDVVKGTDGGGTPTVPYESYLVLARVKVRKGATSLQAADVEDLRFTTTGQGDTTTLAPLRTAPGQSVAALASLQARGGLIYSSDEDRLYYKGATDAKPVVNRAVMMGQTGRGSTGWWGVNDPDANMSGMVLRYDGAAATYDRIGIINYQIRITGPPDREGWNSIWTFSDTTFYWESLRKYEKTNLGLTPHWGSAHVLIPKNRPLKVWHALYAQGGYAQLDEWQSYSQMTILPAE
ncbi:hypothetical protein OU787_17340 [Kitasatospora sp. YST-16]|uniref:hypothetical protein n=1 Tax=Kitasatospora sp. YST-16 TaxID=2998080 RepID=UPI002283C630|nr:hypothetical protein [Kitasatospora sp. YST-16]WAL73114.1 hypothetical protein OU787_17340 [Kitasatospora sp. YST-16]WNW39168.1 hypothetical protein RKE32_17305 [Streptomyces sp. Li-HN-5-13]